MQNVIIDNEKAIISNSDQLRLLQMISVERELNVFPEVLLRKLEEKLEQVKVVRAKSMPQSIITMNSVTRILWLNTEEIKMCWLGYPEAFNYDGHKVNILSPLGIALLGVRVGEVAEQEVPAGSRRFKVLELLYQPEAAKDYHL